MGIVNFIYLIIALDKQPPVWLIALAVVAVMVNALAWLILVGNILRTIKLCREIKSFSFLAAKSARSLDLLLHPAKPTPAPITEAQPEPPKPNTTET